MESKPATTDRNKTRNEPPPPRLWIAPALTCAGSLAALAALAAWNETFSGAQVAALALLAVLGGSAMVALFGARSLRSFLLAWISAILLVAVWVLARGSAADALRYLGFAFLFVLSLGIGLTLLRELVFYLKAPAQTLIDRRIAQLKQNGIHASLHEFRADATGLVLAGGGGKGAYQIGALSALSDFGLSSFAAIAGTSVGALNGVLVAQGSLDAADDIWRKISPGKVLAFPWLRFPLAVAMRIIVSPFLLFRRRVGVWENAAAFNSRTAIIRTWVGLALNGIAALLLFGLVALFAPRGSVSSRNLIQFVPPEAWIAWWSYMLAAAWMALRNLHKFSASSFSLFSNAPLLKLIGRTVDAARIKARAVPIYVTHAALGYQSRALKPAKIAVTEKPARKPPASALGRWWRDNVTGPDDEYRVRDFAGAQPTSEDVVKFVPHYINLLDRAASEINEMVLQSAALPEVFPQRAIDGRDVVDGGLADNMPWSPLLRQRGIRNIVAVYLQKEEPVVPLLYRELAAASERATWKTERMDQVFGDAADMTEVFLADKTSAVPGLRAANRDGVAGFLRHADPVALSTAVSALVIQPSLDPGNLLGGTMNFFGYKSRALMRLGYLDAIDTLERGASDLSEVRRRVLARNQSLDS